LRRVADERGSKIRLGDEGHEIVATLAANILKTESPAARSERD
jgi:hypothetical protein